ncbi:MAG: glycosyltransferase family 2 protein [Akkermansiaceae bacterium]
MNVSSIDDDFSSAPCAKLEGVSIIVPCYNSGRYLVEAIESIYAQDVSIPFEILLVDDGSFDPETPKIIASLYDKYRENGLRVIRNPKNVGAAASRNVALKEAQFEFIFPFDSDNKLGVLDNRDSYMEQGREVLLNNPDILMVYCKGTTFDAREGGWNLLPYSEKALLCNNMLDTHAMYRRSEALSLGGYTAPKGLPEDWVFSVGMHNQRLLLGKPAEIHVFKDDLFYYRVRSDGTNVTSQYNFTQVRPSTITRSLMIKCYPEIYKKYFPNLSAKSILKAVEKQGIRDRVDYYDIGLVGSMKRHFGRVVRHMLHRQNSYIKSLSDVRV